MHPPLTLRPHPHIVAEIRDIACSRGHFWRGLLINRLAGLQHVGVSTQIEGQHAPTERGRSTEFNNSVVQLDALNSRFGAGRKLIRVCACCQRQR